MTQQKITGIKTIPFQGGVVTRNEPALLPAGGFSMIQNMRQRHPGMEQRGGMAQLHTEADGTNKALSLFQFSKGKKTERHFYAQMSDNDVLEATTAPPGVTTGAFGSAVFAGSDNSIPASWGVINDTLIFSNGVDQHQIYPGLASYVKRFIVFKGTAAPPAIPTDGEDYSDQVSDGLTTTVAVLDSLGDLANDYDCIFIMTPVPVDTFTWTVPKANGTEAAVAIKYRKNDNTWAAVSDLTDNTATSSKTLAKSGTMTFTLPTDSMPSYMYGSCGYWYQVYLASGDLDSEVEVSSVTFETDWQSIENIWDGIPVPVIEVQYYDDSASAYKTYGAVSIEIDSSTASDKIYFSSNHKICAFYVDVGGKPNTTASTTLNAVQYGDGAGFTSVGTIVDGTDGLSHSGWVTFGRCPAHKQQFNKSRYYAYWYYFTVDKTLNDDVIIDLYTQPYFDINDYGKGQCNTAWKDRVVYAFDKDQYLFVSAKHQPQALNGSDHGILEPGDGRSNKVLAMGKFHNELMVWQEEKGTDGGCFTLFEGYSPATFGRLVLSTRIGIINGKCFAIVDGVYVSTKTDEIVTTLAFWVSKEGVYMSNGEYVTRISNEIQNYFDPLETECIRRGYENDHWLAYDPTEQTINIGLVSGSSATVPNIFPVYDIEDGTWSFDSRTPALSCMANVEAATGNVPILQVGGSAALGRIYQLNTGTNDVTTKIDAYVIPVFDGNGMNIHIAEMVLRTKGQTAGNCTVTPYINSIAQTAKNLSMIVEIATQTIRRHRENWNLTGQHISFKFQNNTVSQSLYLLDYGLAIEEYEKQ